jgi:hypothetical protein
MECVCMCVHVGAFKHHNKQGSEKADGQADGGQTGKEHHSVPQRDAALPEGRLLCKRKHSHSHSEPHCAPTWSLSVRDKSQLGAVIHELVSANNAGVSSSTNYAHTITKINQKR